MYNFLIDNVFLSLKVVLCCISSGSSMFASIQGLIP